MRQHQANLFLALYPSLFGEASVSRQRVIFHEATATGFLIPIPSSSLSAPQMSIILLNLLLGPPLFRLALVRVGEIKNIPGSAASGEETFMWDCPQALFLGRTI